MIIGGAAIENYSATRAWGVNPGSGSATVVVPTGAAFSIATGSGIAFSFYGIDTFYGIVSDVTSRTSYPGGTKVNIEMVDNRIRLQWAFVFGAFNMEDETYAHGTIQPDLGDDEGSNDTSTGGEDAVSIDEVSSSSAPDDVRFPTGFVINPERRRRFWSILPQHWATGVKSYHDQPLSVRKILNICFANATGHQFGFARAYGSRADQVRPIGLDWLKGASLASIVSQMNDKTGMDLYIQGRSTLRWDVKGVGTLPIYSGPQNPEYSIGTAISADPTRLRVLGGNTIVQVLNVELKPTWNRNWEQFMGEARWRREVAMRWELNEKTHWAEIAAMAREITVAQYCAKVNDYSFADYGSFGFVKRMAMSAWSYMEELCFKHYAVPADSKLFDSIPQDSIRIADSLHCAVEMENDGLDENAKMRYQRQPIEFYPGAKSFVMAKGQPLDALDSRDINAFHALRVTDTRKTWRVMQDYDIDSIGVGVLFKTPVFIDGAVDRNESIFYFPNRGEGGSRSLDGAEGVEALSELLNIVLPNGDYVITPAVVKASFCFELAPFYMDYGTGPRFGVLPADGLAPHVLHMGSDNFSVNGLGPAYPELLRLPSSAGSQTFRELLYADGDSARDKAESAWRSRDGTKGFTTKGGCVRTGVIGTQLGGVIDRVSISIDKNGGISETIDFVRARPSRTYIAEKTMQRLQRLGELYQGHETLKQEIRNLRRIVQADRFAQTSLKRSLSHRSFFDKDRIAIGGGMDTQTKIIATDQKYVSRKAGEVLWLNQQGQPAIDGTAFGGIIVTSADAQADVVNLNIATAGSIPMKLKGEFKPGGIVYVHPGIRYGQPKPSTGAIAVGTYTHVSSPRDQEEYYGIVQIGFGGKEALCGLLIYDLRKKAAEWVVNVRPGFIMCINPKSDAGLDMIKYTMPTPLELDTPTDFTVTSGDTVYVKTITDEKDIIQSATIIVGKDLQTKHAYPPPNSQPGEYYYPLASFKDRTDPAPENGAATVLEIDKLYHCGGTIFHKVNINELYNEEVDHPSHFVDYDVYHDFDHAAARHRLRKLFQVGQRGIPILMERTAIEGGPQDYDIRFRRIAELESDAQIKVIVENGVNSQHIVIRGNGNGKAWNFTRRGEVVGTISFADGLHTGDGGTIELCCDPTSSTGSAIL